MVAEEGALAPGQAKCVLMVRAHRQHRPPALERQRDRLRRVAAARRSITLHLRCAAIGRRVDATTLRPPSRRSGFNRAVVAEKGIGQRRQARAARRRRGRQSARR